MRIASVFEVDKVAQLFAPCYKTLTRQGIFLSVMNLAVFCLLALWIFLDPPRRNRVICVDEYIFLVCKPFDANVGLALFMAWQSVLTRSLCLSCVRITLSKQEEFPKTLTRQNT